MIGWLQSVALLGAEVVTLETLVCWLVTMSCSILKLLMRKFICEIRCEGLHRSPLEPLDLGDSFGRLRR